MRSCISGSVAVAICSASQLMGMVRIAAHIAVARPWSSPWYVGSSGDVAIAAVRFVWHDADGVAISSWRWSRGGVRVPDGWRERASLVWFLTPGMYTIRNWYLSVFSLRLRSPMSSRQRSPKSFNSGL